ncbi:MAG: ABC transporter substrate-binding protein [Propionicimonas sp.]
MSAVTVTRTTTAALAIALVALAGCSGQSPQEPAPTGSSEPTTGAPETGSPGGTPNDLLPAEIREAGKATLATTALYPVCQYFEEEGGPMIGFEVDLWEALARELGITFDVVDTKFDNLIPGVEGGRYDVAMECLSDRPERQDVVTFVDLYYGTGALFMLEETATSGRITEDPLTVCGRSSAVTSGSNIALQLEEVFGENCRSNGKDPVVIQEYPDQSATMNALYSGRADFIISDATAGAYLLQNAPEKLARVESSLWPKVYQGMIINKAETDLQQAVLAAAHAIWESGEYAEIMAKWGLEFVMLEEPGINLATTRPISTP